MEGYFSPITSFFRFMNNHFEFHGVTPILFSGTHDMGQMSLPLKLLEKSLTYWNQNKDTSL